MVALEADQSPRIVRRLATIARKRGILSLSATSFRLRTRGLEGKSKVNQQISKQKPMLLEAKIQVNFWPFFMVNLLILMIRFLILHAHFIFVSITMQVYFIYYCLSWYSYYGKWSSFQGAGYWKFPDSYV